MFGFGRRVEIGKEEHLRRAEAFRSSKRPKKAIAELKKILVSNPQDPQVHAKLGPLFMLTGQRDEALKSFRVAADDFDARGFAAKSMSLWLQIAQAKVTDLGAWEKVTQFHLLAGRKAEGIKVLLSAAAAQLGPAGRPRAVELLRHVLTLSPRHLKGTLALAPLLKKQRQLEEARGLLNEVLQGCTGSEVRRVRKAQFQLTPGLKTLWQWLRA